MAAKASGGLLTFAIINIVIALMAPCSACVGTLSTLAETKMTIGGRDLTPEFKQHIDRKIPGRKVIAVLTLSSNALCALLLLIGAGGLFLVKGWGRSTTVFAALTYIVIFCVHDGVQFGLYAPAFSEFFDAHAGDPPAEDHASNKYAFMTTHLFCACMNPLVMIYLGGMTAYLSTSNSFKEEPSGRRASGGDDRPRRRRRDDDDD